ncbi:MAG: UDP-N-acetylmuramoyl-tripeptide--D-alanyl-D-alanine ligase [Proteobacteria bacterium]|nr:UDP-N-acetylmuramoyl-tripeptide--D-alanyl-D-alanine ligase [Pseudomonadota bacterium]MDE3208507.1 UDP-N-acetylmuramoyl-tripeptide--D-alanyl-D-alanine ligase [Pseudomonadota bacterium]
MFEIEALASELGATAFLNARIYGVSIDSRSIKAGELFVALNGEHFDGHDFVPMAFEKGAAAAMISRRVKLDRPCLMVEDTRLALGKLAKLWRGKFNVPIVGVTGSNGKTTVKEMIASIAVAEFGQNAVLATRGNLNNDIGLPLTLLRLRAAHRIAVLEMGMNHPGEIRYLSDRARPNIALINNAQNAHLQGLGTVEAVARAKGEIYEGLDVSGTAVINSEDKFFTLWKSLAGSRQVLTYGISQGEVRANYTLGPDHSNLTLFSPAGQFGVRLNVAGEHNVKNALAATAVATAAHIGIEAIRVGLESFSGVSGRLQMKVGKKGVKILDDTYNANPDSVKAGIQVLARYPGQRVLVLGDMGELGEHVLALHSDIGNVAREAGIDALYTLGQFSIEAQKKFGGKGQHFYHQEELVGYLKGQLDKDMVVLVKGSRFMKMERVVQELGAWTENDSQ